MMVGRIVEIGSSIGLNLTSPHVMKDKTRAAGKETIMKQRYEVLVLWQYNIRGL